MRIKIPSNNVKYDYENVIRKFVALLADKQRNNLECVYLSGSYARGDANNDSDIDIFCLFGYIDNSVMQDVGYCARNMSVEYDILEINAQCMTVTEFLDEAFEDWGYGEYGIRELDSVLLYGKIPFVDKPYEIRNVYKKYLGDIIMSIRHYICVDAPKEKLTHKKIKNYILKPLMFALRLERYCNTENYPLSISDLYHSYADERRRLVEYFCNADKFDQDIETDHKAVLNYLHTVIVKMI